MTAQDGDLPKVTAPPDPLLVAIRGARGRTWRRQIVAVVLTVILSVSIPHFMELRNILNILEQLSILGFMAIGMTYATAAGGIDLSVYTVVSAAAVVGATVMVDHDAPDRRMHRDDTGSALSKVNGVAIALGRMIPFIVTLSTMVLAQGFAHLVHPGPEHLRACRRLYRRYLRRSVRHPGAGHYHHHRCGDRRHRSGLGPNTAAGST